MNTSARYRFSLTGLLIIVTGLLSPSMAQTFTVSDASSMTIFGSANVTDWEAEVTSITGHITVTIPENADWSDAQASWFDEVDIRIPVGDIDADSRRMNRNMHDYLKEDDYPEITYRLVQAKELVVLDNPGFKLTVLGTVSAAGESVELEHDVVITPNQNGGFTVTGSQDLKMTDFGIDPPTAVLGSIRSRDEMTIEFELVLE
ncbi:YceI family protein [Balneolales bacterium ANBcel1]|nr:YceI family protein [Balneolales bacterium ANBcel1]